MGLPWGYGWARLFRFRFRFRDLRPRASARAGGKKLRELPTLARAISARAISARAISARTDGQGHGRARMSLRSAFSARTGAASGQGQGQGAPAISGPVPTFARDLAGVFVCISPGGTRARAGAERRGKCYHFFVNASARVGLHLARRNMRGARRGAARKMLPLFCERGRPRSFFVTTFGAKSGNTRRQARSGAAGYCFQCYHVTT